MAGLTTASLVSLIEPEETEQSTLEQGVLHRDGPSRSRIAKYLGLDASVTPLNAFALASSALLSITYLVFLNASQPFLLDSLGVPESQIGRTTGNLILADELVALAFYCIFGTLSDRIGVRWVAVSGHFICGTALVCYVHCPVNILILARILFAIGASALVTVLSAAFSSMAAAPGGSDERNVNECDEDERTQLLDRGAGSESGVDRSHQHHPSSRFAGVLGFSTGFGALIAVTIFLPLPARLANNFSSISPSQALRYTYYLNALLALLESIFLIKGLKLTISEVTGVGENSEDISTEQPPSKSFAAEFRSTLLDMTSGFRMAFHEHEVALGLLASFCSRSSSSIVTGFIPLSINRFFTSHDLCTLALNPHFGDASRECRPAYIKASILTGIVQLVSLLASPLIGQLASSISLILTLGIVSLTGAIAFSGWALLPDGGDPRGIWPILFSALAGLSQIGLIVASLSIVAEARGKIRLHKGKEVAGAIAAAYSISGGLGILIVGTCAGWLFDRWSAAPFSIVAILNLCSSIAAFLCFRRRRISSSG